MTGRFYLVNSKWIIELDPLSGSALNEFQKKSLEMRMFNVGAGESILLRNQSKAIFVDGGSNQRKERNVNLGDVLRKFLKNKVKLNVIVASHNHVDHLNALSTMLKDPIDNILAKDAYFYYNGEVMGTWLSRTLMNRMEKLEKKNLITIQEITDFTKIGGFGKQNITMFVNGRNKPKPVYKSIFMHIPYGNATFLLTGDAYKSYEDDLTEDSQKSAYLRSDVLKITHHGSSGGTSENFLENVRPAISVSSSTIDPNHKLESDVKKRILKHGGIIKVTGSEDGDIIIRTDGYEWESEGDRGVLYEVDVEKPGIFNPDH
ncbi:MAG: hypothetical protein O6761_00855 [Thaumarchaeota archaeon]|nr:hypothetical protein [Nitrososphaerota archaeon]